MFHDDLVALPKGTCIEFTKSVKFSLCFFQPFQWTGPKALAAAVFRAQQVEKVGNGTDLLKESL